MTADFLTGRRALDSSEIEALVAHELGHRRHRDGLVAGAAWWYWAPVLAVDAVARLLGRIPFLGAILYLVVTLPLLLLFWPIHLLWRPTSVPREFLADRFAVDCGYGIPLERVFTYLAQEQRNYWKLGLREVILASHPPMADRIARIHDAIADEVDVSAGGTEEFRRPAAV